MNAFIFDVDGTLAESEEWHRASFNEAFAGEGLGWSWDEDGYRELLKVSGGKERLRYFIERDGHALTEPADLLIPRLHAAKTRIYAEGVRSGRLAFRPGVGELITQAKKRGVRLAIATTTTRDNVDSLLEVALGGTADFEVIACGDMVPNKKPAPDIYLLALQELGLAPEACLAFEDSQNGLRAAKSAGLRCVVTPALYTRGEDFSGADLVVADLRNQGPIFTLIQ